MSPYDLSKAQRPTAPPRPWWVGRFSSAGNALVQAIGPVFTGIAIALSLTKPRPQWWLWITIAFLILGAGLVLRGLIGAVALRRRPEWAYVRQPTRPWVPEELRLIRWLGAGLTGVALILFLLSVLTGFGGDTLEILGGVGLVIGVLAALATGLARPEPPDPTAP